MGVMRLWANWRLRADLYAFKTWALRYSKILAPKFLTWYKYRSKNAEQNCASSDAITETRLTNLKFCYIYKLEVTKTEYF